MAWVLAVTCWLTYAYFYQGGDWNQNSRLALALCLAERGTVEIGGYVHMTGDWSRLGDRFYSNKGPGPSFLVAPFFMLADQAQRCLGVELSPFWRGNLYLWLASVLSVGALSAASVAAFFVLLQRLCPGQRRWNWTASALYGVGTAAFPFSTAWYGHQSAGALLMLAFLLLQVEGHSRRAVLGRRVGLAGLVAGAAVSCDYPAAGAVLVLTGLAWWRFGGRGRAMWWWLAGVGVPLACLAVYNQRVTGVFFETAYGYENPAFRQMARFELPEWWKFGALLFGPDRGLFFSSPVLAFGLVAGTHGAWKRQRAVCVVILVVFVFALVFNACLSAWEGGATFTARYLIVSVPFVALLLGWVPRRLRLPAAVLGGLSAAMMLVATSVSISSPEWSRPFSRYYFPNFVAGRLSLNSQHAFEANVDRPRPLGLPACDRRWCSFNAGELLGLGGLASLLPLGVLWLLCLVVCRPGLVAAGAAEC